MDPIIINQYLQKLEAYIIANHFDEEERAHGYQNYVICHQKTVDEAIMAGKLYYVFFH